jgi:signal transduction histidine kinase
MTKTDGGFRGAAMSGNLWLDWAILSLSIINIVLMLWLGWMILLSAEKRTWGVYLAASGLFAGTLFFTSHAVLLGENIPRFNLDVSFWWHLGWAPIIAAPFAWYIVMVWFAGYWDEGGNRLRDRHRPWMTVTIVYAVLLLLLLFVLDPLGNRYGVAVSEYEAGRGLNSLPLLYIAYPVFILLCIILSMDALLRPAPARRKMGEMAREKARPWLSGAGFIFLLTAIMVSFVVGWVLENSWRTSDLPQLYGNIAPTLAWIDLILSLLITTAVILIGQAVVSYEIFTGKPLPRRGFRRQWGRAIALAVSIGMIGSLVYQLELRQIYLLIFVSLLAASFFALFSWRGSVEREQSIRQLRPFLFSQNLTDIILTSQDLPALIQELRQPFGTLIRDVLGVEKGYLHISGSLGQYYPLRLSFPDPELDIPIPQPAGKSINSGFPAEPLDPETQDGFAWLIPLTSERGQDGVFLLGNKLDDSFITQEEIEIARAAAERMVDVLISTELAIQLVHLQRDQMADQALSEQRPRRYIHDEILPRLHALMLSISSKGTPSNEPVLTELAAIHKELAGMIREMPASPPGRVMQVGFKAAILEMIAREYPASFTEVEWQMDEGFENQLQERKETAREVLFYASREVIRNAAKYAHPAGDELVRPSLKISCTIDPTLEVIVEDNGQGITQPYPSGELGRGQGLFLHHLMLTIAGGNLVRETEVGKYSRFRLSL